jgi:hypothetical protein
VNLIRFYAIVGQKLHQVVEHRIMFLNPPANNINATKVLTAERPFFKLPNESLMCMANLKYEKTQVSL